MGVGLICTKLPQKSKHPPNGIEKDPKGYVGREITIILVGKYDVFTHLSQPLKRVTLYGFLILIGFWWSEPSNNDALALLPLHYHPQSIQISIPKSTCLKSKPML